MPWFQNIKTLAHSSFTFALVVLLGFSHLTLAETTQLNVLVRSVDSKFIGSGVGGLNVTITDDQTGKLLAQGAISGATGDTQALMKTGQTRGHSTVTDDSAQLQATLDIDKPTRVAIRVTGPLSVAQSVQTLSATTWVVPGRDQTRPGVVLHMPGLITELIDYKREGKSITLTTQVTMMCGCPITGDGLWAADDFKVVAQLYQAGERLTQNALAFTGETNIFAGRIKVPQSGASKLVIYAYQESTGNTGVYEQALTE